MNKITAHYLQRFCSILFLACLGSINSFAQNQHEMADTMRSNGKIYVVVTVCLVILIGLFLYVWRLDRKITRLEKNQ